jgi:hypothetical protein
MLHPTTHPRRQLTQLQAPGRAGLLPIQLRNQIRKFALTGGKGGGGRGRGGKPPKETLAKAWVGGRGLGTGKEALDEKRARTAAFWEGGCRRGGRGRLHVLEGPWPVRELMRRAAPRRPPARPPARLPARTQA